MDCSVRVKSVESQPDSKYTTTWSPSGELGYATLADGTRLRYLRVGSGPTALIFLHTVRTQLDHFQLVIPRILHAFTVYAVDFPGMGWSDITVGASYAEPALRRSIVELVTALDRQLKVRDIEIVKEEFAVANEGLRLFGVMEVNVPTTNGFGFVLGIRTANDRTFATQLASSRPLFLRRNLMLSTSSRRARATSSASRSRTIAAAPSTASSTCSLKPIPSSTHAGSHPTRSRRGLVPPMTRIIASTRGRLIPWASALGSVAASSTSSGARR